MFSVKDIFAFAAPLVVVGAATGALIAVQDGDSAEETAAAPARAAQVQPGSPRTVGQVELRPAPGQTPYFGGTAVVAATNDGPRLVVSARLHATKHDNAYEVWLYNSRDDARSIGAQRPEPDGTFEGAAALPADFARYRYIDISHERVDNKLEHSGRSVLRASLKELKPPPSTP